MHGSTPLGKVVNVCDLGDWSFKKWDSNLYNMKKPFFSVKDSRLCDNVQIILQYEDITSSLQSQSDFHITLGYADTLICSCHNINTQSGIPTKTDSHTWNATSSAPLARGPAQCQFQSTTHTYTPAHRQTHRAQTGGPGGEGGCDTEIPVHWYLPLITMCEGHLSPALARLSINHCGMGMMGIHGGSYCLPVFPAHPSSPCCL